MMRHRLRKWVATCTIAAAVWSAPSSRAATPEEVDKAIEKAQEYLLSHRNKEGNWEESPRPMAGEKDSVVDLKGRQWGGLTSIATYALLASGMDVRKPDIKKAVDFLLTANITSTYGLGLSSQIVVPEFHVGQKETADLIKRNTELLLAGMNQPAAAVIKNPSSWPASAGFYGYWVGSDFLPRDVKFGKELNAKTIGGPMPKGHFDRSNSQYGVLGMWALAQAGGEIPTLYWQIVDAAWKKAQLSDGAWNYTKGGEEPAPPTPSMTAAGIATLFITQDYISENDWGECKGAVKNTNIERALAWMDKHIDQALAGDTYTMYGIERIGTASGRKYFGTKDWYEIGADFLVKHQAKDGSFAGGHGVIPSTSFALTFLSRGRAPVMMNKLIYTSAKGDAKAADPWDERPRDVANLARWVGPQVESYFNWQVVNLKVPPEELHDSPILYIAGSQALDFTKEEQAKLRTFVEQGGMILGNADCEREIFNKSFIELGKQLFPQYEFRQSAPNDFVYMEQFRNFRNKPKVLELYNGVRKLMVLIPQSDPARRWQTRSYGTSEASFGLGANIFLYAADKKNLSTKGRTYLVEASSKVHPLKTLKVARLDVGGNPNPEPGGWPRMAAVMHNFHGLDLKVDYIKPEALTNEYKVADLTGTSVLGLSAPGQAAIKKFVEAGGTLIADAAGGDAAFADAVETALNQMFPDKKPELLPLTHYMFNEPTDRIEEIQWREFAVDKVADKKNPKVRGIEVGKRTGVFFSREDLSAGIVGEPVDGIYGYSPTTATNIMAGMLIYAENGGIAPPPTTMPMTRPANSVAVSKNGHHS